MHTRSPVSDAAPAVGASINEYYINRRYAVNNRVTAVRLVVDRDG